MTSNFKQEKGDPGQVAKYFFKNPNCQVCGDPASEVHHIVPAHSRMKIEHVLNYLSVCRNCHIRLHRYRHHEMVVKGLNFKLETLNKEK